MNNAALYRILEETDIEGKYHLQTLIGAGGFGAVFRAEERLSGQVLREVAVKIISPIEHSQQKQLAELIAALNFDHPHLLRCFSAGEFEFRQMPFLYLVMELAEYSLQDYLKAHSLSPSQVCELTQQVALGLDYLHREQQQVHRDLKPANVLWVRNRWVISDFGLVRKLNEESYVHSQGMGTVAYMPPEAWEGKLSFAWDIWSLGIVIAAALNQGRPPYDFQDEMELIKKVMNGALQLPELPSELQEIVREGCLKQERRSRWQAQQILQALAKDPQKHQTPPFPIDLSSQFSVEIITVDEKGQINHGNKEQAQQITEDLGYGIELEMVAVPGGDFLMGAPETEEGSRDWERPQHPVQVASFLMAKYPITQAQYEAVRGEDPSRDRGMNNPMVYVNWHQAVEFCQRLSEKTGKPYRLPSEAEWEYACRAGTTTPFCFGETITSELANYDGSYTYGKEAPGKSRQKTMPVGSFPPNAFGLFDLHGHVFEWCEDVWHDTYQGAPTDGRAWLFSGDDQRRVLRGGAWSNDPRFCRSAFRISYPPDHCNIHFGFRAVYGLKSQ